jgi:hypothetical protein
MTRMTVTMHNAQQGHTQLLALWHQAKAMLTAGQRVVMELRKETRSLKENAMLHAMLSYISKNIEWSGKKRDVDTWKRLLVAAWCRAKNEQVEILPAVDGHGVDIVFRKTSTLTRGECADLIEFIFAWGVMNDYPIPDKSSVANIDYETGEIYK